MSFELQSRLLSSFVINIERYILEYKLIHYYLYTIYIVILVYMYLITRGFGD